MPPFDLRSCFDRLLNRRPRRRRASSCDLSIAAVERLEPRLLLTKLGSPIYEFQFPVTFDFEPYADLNSNGVLKVGGTNEADYITVETSQVFVGWSITKYSIQPRYQTVIDVTISEGYMPPRNGINAGTGNGFTNLQPAATLLTAQFSVSQVNSIEIYANGGGDFVENSTSIASDIEGGHGDDTLVGGSGDDTIQGENDNDVIFAGYGDDTLLGGLGRDILRGEGDDDVMSGGDDLYNSTVDDRMYGGLGDDWMDGEGGNDVIDGESGYDTILGGAGDDTLSGGSYGDHVYGGEGDDDIDGGSSSDTLHGDEGNDTLRGGSGNDLMYGGRYEYYGFDLLEGDSGNDTLYGNNGNDTLVGGRGDDTLYGGSHDDVLFGGDDDDRLYGHSGNDGLFGGKGDNYLSGSSGADRYLVMRDEQGNTDDSIGYLSSVDARINFKDGSTTATKWKSDQIELIDQAFAILADATNNTKFLKTSGGGEITFVLKDTTSSFGGLNNGFGTITIEDTNFDLEDDWAVQIVIHEIGHNWEEENPYWGDFKALSGWTTWVWWWDASKYTYGGNGWSYRNTANFASGYGEGHPIEDFAEVFAYYFMDRAGRDFNSQTYVANSSDIADKLDIVDQVVAWLR